jgi:TPR repeat protein
MKKLLTALVIIVSFGTAGSVYAQDFDKGLRAAQSGDFVTALKEWTALAEQGDASAQYNLGQMYDKGQGVIQDYKEAMKWFRRSAEQGITKAQNNFGVVYAKGKGVGQDYKREVKWYRKAAEQGNASAQYGLGFKYRKGIGVVQDNVYAHMWFNIAASNGNQGAMKGRDMIAKQMTAADISKAQGLARACVEKKFKGC